MDIPGDMDIGVAAGPMSLAAAGEPPVFSIRLGLIIQPDLETLDIAVPVAARHQKPRMAEDVPVSPVNIEARDALQIVKVGKDARQKTPGWDVWGNEVEPTIRDFGTIGPKEGV